MAKTLNHQLGIRQCALRELDLEKSHQREVEVTKILMRRTDPSVAVPAAKIDGSTTGCHSDHANGRSKAFTGGDCSMAVMTRDWCPTGPLLQPGTPQFRPKTREFWPSVETFSRLAGSWEDGRARH